MAVAILERGCPCVRHPQVTLVNATPRRLRIAFLVDGFNLGGTELNAVRVAEAAEKDRCMIALLAMSPERGPLPSRYRAAEIAVHDFSFRGLAHPDLLFMVPRLASWLRRHRVNVLHCHDIYSNIYGMLAARLLGASHRRPFLITSRRFGAFQQRHMAVANGLAYRVADAVLANSEGVRELLIREGNDPARITVVPNFVDDFPTGDAGGDTAAWARWRSRFNLPSNAVLVGCVARLERVKDHHTLLLAFTSVRERVPDAHLVLVGEGTLRTELATYADTLGIGHAVHFAGFQSNSRNLHCGFDISVLSSRSEGFPNSLVEAMAAGVPIVASNVGGVPDAVQDGVTGFLFPVGSSTTLGDCICRLALDPALREEFGANARRHAERNYTRASVMEQWMALWSRGEAYNRD
jgi:glycosyltransferase involved in cell wall biosynthesis